MDYVLILHCFFWDAISFCVGRNKLLQKIPMTGAIGQGYFNPPFKVLFEDEFLAQPTYTRTEAYIMHTVKIN